MNTVKIQIPSLLENIRIVESFIDNAKDKFKFSDDVYGNIMISVTEAVSNAIKHGNKLSKDKNVTLTLELSEKQITFLVEDEGEGFDTENIADPTLPENIDKPGGRGIFLIQALTDGFNFHDNGRKLELIFNV